MELIGPDVPEHQQGCRLDDNTIREQYGLFANEDFPKHVLQILIVLNNLHRFSFLFDNRWQSKFMRLECPISSKVVTLDFFNWSPQFHHWAIE